ncbi:MAG: FkbM family methyltransferase [Pseudomonadota bacterium]
MDDNVPMYGVRDANVDLEAMRATLLFHELVSFAQLGDYGLFMPGAAAQTKRFLRWRPHEIINPVTFIQRRNYNKLIERWRPNKDPASLRSDCRVYLTRILEQLKRANLSVGCFDVGGYLGLYSVFFGTLARQRGLKTRIRCFEPGPTQDLIEANAEINELAEMFELRRAAVSDVSGPILYEYDAGKTLSGGLNEKKSGSFARLARSTILDDEIENGFSDFDCIIMKLDVEGFEANALRGLSKHRKKAAVIICEIQPWARTKRVGDRSFQEMLAEDYYLIDIANAMWPSFYEPINGDDLDDYYGRVSARQNAMSDMILINKKFKLAEDLYKALIAIDPFDRTGLAVA